MMSIIGTKSKKGIGMESREEIVFIAINVNTAKDVKGFIQQGKTEVEFSEEILQSFGVTSGQNHLPHLL